MPRDDYYQKDYAPDENFIRSLPQPQDPTPKQKKVFAKLQETMWKKHKISWGLDRISESDKDGWTVCHTPAAFFGFALNKGEIDQETHDGFKKRYGYLWSSMDLVR